MTEASSGFTHATFDFLHDLRAHNNRHWFDAHKSDYRDHVLLPLQALASELGSLMQSIDPEIEIAPGKAVSRVYRDTRFAKDKSPYKTSHWITFKRPRKEWQNFPAFFFEISPGAYRYGMGLFDADRATMDRFREAIDTDPAAFVASIAFHTRPGDFGIEGDEYKRPLKTDVPAELQPWYNRKNLYVVTNRTIGDSGIDGPLVADLTRGFELLTPLYHYLSRAAIPLRPTP